MKNILLALLTAVIFYGCGKGGKTAEPVVSVGKVTMLLPAQNELCTQGTNITPNQSTVAFKWTAAEHATVYEVNVKDLEGGAVISKITTGTQADIALKRNTPYSWSVTAKLAAATTKSESWKFFNAGPAAVSYAPFPAEIVSPLMGQQIVASNGKVTLSWTGSDVDNDIANYDIYWGDVANPALLKQNTTETTIQVNAVAGKTYYWKIISRDTKGNTSNSGIYNFTIK